MTGLEKNLRGGMEEEENCTEYFGTCYLCFHSCVWLIMEYGPGLDPFI